MLFQLLIFFLPQKFPARSSKPVFLFFALSFSASFSPVCRPLIYEQVQELGVKLRHVIHED